MAGSPGLELLVHASDPLLLLDVESLEHGGYPCGQVEYGAHTGYDVGIPQVIVQDLMAVFRITALPPHYVVVLDGERH